MAKKTKLVVLVAVANVILSLTYAIIMKFVFAAYFMSSHMALMCVVSTLLAISEMILISRPYGFLFLGPTTGNRLVAASCLVFFILMLASMTAFFVLFAIELGTNCDAIVAAVFGLWCSLTLFVPVYVALTSSIYVNEYFPAIFTNANARASRSKDKYGVYPSNERTKQGLCLSFYGVLYLVLFVFYFGTVYFPISRIQDVIHYQDIDWMHLITVRDHRAIPMYLHCYGNGSDTLVIETGLGASPATHYPYLVHFLRTKYRVCLVGRRGYGWSGSLENDHPRFLWSGEKQYTVTNTEYLVQLLETLGTEVYLAGHSYGGHHILYATLKRPDLVKGLIFLDSSTIYNSDDPPVDDEPARDQWYLVNNIIANMQPLGLLQLAMDLKLFPLESFLTDIFDFDGVSDMDLGPLLAEFKNGNQYAAYVREIDSIYTLSVSEVSKALNMSAPLRMPTMEILAGGRGSSLPREKFPSLSDDDIVNVEGSNHNTLVGSRVYTKRVACSLEMLMDKHIANRVQINC